MPSPCRESDFMRIKETISDLAIAGVPMLELAVGTKVASILATPVWRVCFGYYCDYRVTFSLAGTALLEIQDNRVEEEEDMGIYDAGALLGPGDAGSGP